MPKTQKDLHQLTLFNEDSSLFLSPSPSNLIKKSMNSLVGKAEVKKYNLAGYQLNETDYMWVKENFNIFKKDLLIEEESLSLVFEDKFEFEETTELDVFASEIVLKVIEGSIIEIDTSYLSDTLSALEDSVLMCVVCYSNILDFGKLQNLEKLDITIQPWVISDINIENNFKLKELSFTSYDQYYKTKIKLPKNASLLKKVNIYGNSNINVLDLSSCYQLNKLYIGPSSELEDLKLPNFDFKREVDFSISGAYITTLYCTAKQKEYLKQKEHLENISEIFIYTE